MLRTLFDQWILDWRESRGLFWFESVGTISSLIAAVLISFWPTAIHLGWIFGFWLIGSGSLAISSFIRNTGWPMILMSTYTVLNIIGLYNVLK